MWKLSQRNSINLASLKATKLTGKKHIRMKLRKKQNNKVDLKKPLYWIFLSNLSLKLNYVKVVST